MQEAEGKLFELSQTNMKKDYTQIDPVIKEAYEMLQKAAARTDGMSGIPSGFHALDKMTSGWQNSDLETALITHLQDFILELGMGFCFEERQKKMLIDDRSCVRKMRDYIIRYRSSKIR